MASPLHPIGWRWTFAICVASACVGAGCWTASAARTAAAPIVTVTAGKPSEFAFTLSKSSGLPAVVSFSVTNRGALAHAFKVAGAATRVLAPGQSTILTVSFARPGTYEYRSSVPGQAAKGMRGRLVVAPAAVKPAAPSTATTLPLTDLAAATPSRLPRPFSRRRPRWLPTPTHQRSTSVSATTTR